MVNLNLRIAEVKDNTREELIKALRSLAENDCDFTGENGLEYLWESVWEVNGFEDMEDWENDGEPTLYFESNLDYVSDLVRHLEDDKDCVESFIKIWLEHDGYYIDYQYDLLTDSNGITAIVLAYNYCN